MGTLPEQTATGEVKVWDPLVRVFHWTLVAAFAVAYVTEDDWLTLHVYAGYLIIGLLAVRVLWGLVGTRHARFSDFWYGPARAFAYGREVLLARAPRYLGHNPAGGLMIFCLLGCLVLISVSGLAAYAVEERAGPLAGMLGGLGGDWGDAFEEIHEFLANATLALVAVHVAGVVVESLLHRENLVRAMFTGRKRAP